PRGPSYTLQMASTKCCHTLLITWCNTCDDLALSDGEGENDSPFMPHRDKPAHYRVFVQEI
ncbi:hypothetical protein KIPB_001866, partial [Kipferlia bialata]